MIKACPNCETADYLTFVRFIHPCLLEPGKLLIECDGCKKRGQSICIGKGHGGELQLKAIRAWNETLESETMGVTQLGSEQGENNEGQMSVHRDGASQEA